MQNVNKAISGCDVTKWWEMSNKLQNLSFAVCVWISVKIGVSVSFYIPLNDYSNWSSNYSLEKSWFWDFITAESWHCDPPSREKGDTSDNLVHIIIFVTKWSTRLHHWTEDSTILITVVLYDRSQIFSHYLFIFFSIVIFEYAACVVSW